MAGKMSDIEDAINQAIDGSEVLDASQVPGYYARQAGPFAGLTQGRTPQDMNNDQNTLAKIQASNSPRWGIDKNDQEDGDEGPSDASYAATPHGNINLAREASYAMKSNAPFNQGSVEGIGSTGVGNPGLGPNPGASKTMQGNTWAGTPYANYTEGEGPEDYRAQFDPTQEPRRLPIPTDNNPKQHPLFPDDERGNAYGSSGPAQNPAPTKTPMDRNDAALLAQQKNATHAAGGDTPIIRTPALRSYFHKLNPMVSYTDPKGKETMIRYNDLYKD